MPFLFAFCFFIISTSSVFAGAAFLAISDIHYGPDNTSQEGADTGPLLLNIALNKFRALSSNIDFILNLGDLPTHETSTPDQKGKYERVLFHALYQADYKKKPMFYIPGNNDSLAGDYQAFKTGKQSPLAFALDWTGACVFCKHLLINDQFMYQGGFYSSYVIPGNKEVILIVLNSAPFTKVPLTEGQEPYAHQDADAELELDWFAKQVKTHSAKQLLIAMHVPSGSMWHEHSLQRFVSILNKYTSTYGQVSLLTGHTHMDGLRKLTLPNGTNIYDYAIPSISRIHYNNPGMKIFTLNHDMKISNYTTYYTSYLNKWDSQHYDARGTPDAIFSQCHAESLAQCLNFLSNKQICDDLDQGFFYGVKNKRVFKKICYLTYLIG